MVPCRRRGRLGLIVLCICLVDVTSPRHVTRLDIRTARYLSPAHAARSTTDTVQRKLTSPEKEAEAGPSEQTLPARRATPRLSAAPPCGQYPCTSSADRQNDVNPNDATLDAEIQRPLYVSSGTSSMATRAGRTSESSDEDRRRSEDPRDGSVTLKPDTGTFPSGLHQPSQPRPHLPPVRRVRTTRDALVLLVPPPTRQRPPSTDGGFQIAWNSADGVTDEDVKKDAAEGKPNEDISVSPLPRGLSESGRRRIQLFWQPLTRNVEDEMSSVSRPAGRVRRAKRPRYYRNNGAYWTRRNWRVNLMRVWGKRHQQMPRHRT